MEHTQTLVGLAVDGKDVLEDVLLLQHVHVVVVLEAERRCHENMQTQVQRSNATVRRLRSAQWWPRYSQ